MRLRVALALLLFSAGGLGLIAALLPGAGEAVELAHRRFVPGLSADSAPATAPTPTPTPTPIPGPGSGSDLSVALFFEIDAKELAVSGTGTTIVHISAQVFAPLPTADQPVVSTTGTFTIAPHPPDAAGCTWTRTVTKNILAATFFHTTDLSIVANLDAPEWFYTLQCPESPPFRFPAFGEEGMFLFLQEIMAPYRQGAGVRLPTDVVPGLPISCIKRHALFLHGPTELTGIVTVEVFVYQKPCTLPS